MKIHFFIILIGILTACSDGFGSKLSSDKLDVYFDAKENMSLADSLGSYWTKNQFTSGKKQSIKLKETENYFALLLIESDTNSQSQLSFDEQFMFLDLKKELDSLFFKNKEVRIFACDNKFEPLYELTAID